MQVKFRIFIYILMVACTSISGCSCGNHVRNNTSEFIDVYLEQDGTIINFIGDSASLRRGQFRFVFNFSDPDSVLLNASFQSYLPCELSP